MFGVSAKVLEFDQDAASLPRSAFGEGISIQISDHACSHGATNLAHPSPRQKPVRPIIAPHAAFTCVLWCKNSFEGQATAVPELLEDRTGSASR